MSRIVRTWMILAVALAVAFAGRATPADQPAGQPAVNTAALACLVQSFDKVEKEEYDWGWIRWLMNAELDPQSEMTLGIVQVNAGQSNPAHVHGNCDEVLYVLSGSCEHRVGDRWVTLEAGDVIRIPRGVPHAARTLDEPLKVVVVYNTGRREFTPVEDDAAKP